MSEQASERTRLGDLLAMANAVPQPTVMRAPTKLERVRDAVQRGYEWLSDQPLFRLSDLLGMTDVRGIAEEQTQPNGLKLGIMPEGPGKGIKAFHGSPHDFETFDLSKIGTGEGAQAYGHGLYFAENENVAREYRDALRRRGSNWDDPANIAGQAIDGHGGDRYKAADALRQTLDYWKKNPTSNPAQLKANERTAAALRLLEEGGNVAPSPNPGRMYEVNIAADPTDFLDWDAPLSQQSEKVQEAARKNLLRGEYGRYSDRKIGSGEGLYREAEALAEHQFRHRGVTPAGKEGATERLKQAGIPGIKYLDQGSRANVKLLAPNETVHGQWLVKDMPNGSVLYRGPDEAAAKSAYAQHQASQTRNYVVFDDKLISIVKKYGIAGAVSAGLINRAQAAQLQAQGYQ